MPDFLVTARRKAVDDAGYDRVLDMYEATAHRAPVDVVDSERVYLLTAPDSSTAARSLGDFMNRSHLGSWGDHIARFSAEAQ